MGPRIDFPSAYRTIRSPSTLWRQIARAIALGTFVVTDENKLRTEVRSSRDWGQVRMISGIDATIEAQVRLPWPSRSGSRRNRGSYQSTPFSGRIATEISHAETTDIAESVGYSRRAVDGVERAPYPSGQVCKRIQADAQWQAWNLVAGISSATCSDGICALFRCSGKRRARHNLVPCARRSPPSMCRPMNCRWRMKLNRSTVVCTCLTQRYDVR